MGLALEMYVHENGNYYPFLNAKSGIWFQSLSPYGPGKWTDRSYHCPGYKGAISLFPARGNAPHDPLGSYAYNWQGVAGYDSLSPLYTNNLVNLGLSGICPIVQEAPPISESRVNVPSEMLAIGESRHRGEHDVLNDSCVDALFCGNIAGYYDYYGVPPLPERHGKNYNQLFCDGQVTSMDTRILYNPTNSAALWNNDHQPHPELWFGLDLHNHNW